MPKTIRIDQEAYKILFETKKRLKERGYENPTLSAAIRELESYRREPV